MFLLLCDDLTNFLHVFTPFVLWRSYTGHQVHDFAEVDQNLMFDDVQGRWALRDHRLFNTFRNSLKYFHAFGSNRNKRVLCCFVLWILNRIWCSYMCDPHGWSSCKLIAFNATTPNSCWFSFVFITNDETVKVFTQRVDFLFTPGLDQTFLAHVISNWVGFR